MNKQIALTIGALSALIVECYMILRKVRSLGEKTSYLERRLNGHVTNTADFADHG